MGNVYENVVVLPTRQLELKNKNPPGRNVAKKPVPDVACPVTELVTVVPVGNAPFRSTRNWVASGKSVEYTVVPQVTCMNESSGGGGGEVGGGKGSGGDGGDRLGFGLGGSVCTPAWAQAQRVPSTIAGRPGPYGHSLHKWVAHLAVVIDAGLAPWAVLFTEAEPPLLGLDVRVEELHFGGVSLHLDYTVACAA